MKDLTPRKEDLNPIEIASRDEIAALQLERMKWSLAHAYENVPFYKASFDKAGVHPDDLQSLDDLAKFPFTVKQDLRDNYPFGMFAIPREQVKRIHASSGTTGQPTVVGYSENDLKNWGEVVARSLRASGARQVFNPNVWHRVRRQRPVRTDQAGATRPHGQKDQGAITPA